MISKFEAYQKRNWTKIFSGYWSILTCSYLGLEHSKIIKETLGFGLDTVIVIIRKGWSSCYYDKSELETFGNQLAKHVKKNPEIVDSWCAQVKKNTDNLKKVMNQSQGKNISLSEFKSFLTLLHGYVPPYVSVKQIANFLSKEKLQKILPVLDESRLYSEDLYTQVEKFMQSLAETISKKTGYPTHLVLSCTKEEFETYLQKKVLPHKKVLEERYKSCGFIFRNGEYDLISGYTVKDLEQQLLGDMNQIMTKGQTAYPGKVKGRIKIIFDPQNVTDFKKGDILVTG